LLLQDEEMLQGYHNISSFAFLNSSFFEVFPMLPYNCPVYIMPCLCYEDNYNYQDKSFFNGVVAFTFLKLINALSVSIVFWLYAAIGVLAIFWGYRYIPETKGITLEQIEDNWRDFKKLREFKT